MAEFAKFRSFLGQVINVHKVVLFCASQSLPLVNPFASQAVPPVSHVTHLSVSGVSMVL